MFELDYVRIMQIVRYVHELLDPACCYYHEQPQL